MFRRGGAWQSTTQNPQNETAYCLQECRRDKPVFFGIGNGSKECRSGRHVRGVNRAIRNG